jgi:flavodoxin
MNLEKELSGVAKVVAQIMDEELKGQQHQIDANKNNKIDAHDFNRDEKKVDVEQLDETMTRKHFQQVADVIKAHPDQKKRNELAKHHAKIFKASNPRFDHGRFYKAAGANLTEEVEQVEEMFNKSDPIGARKKTNKGIATKTTTGVKHERSVTKGSEYGSTDWD